MRILKRVNTILTAHVNEVIDTFEKPDACSSRQSAKWKNRSRGRSARRRKPSPPKRDSSASARSAGPRPRRPTSGPGGLWAKTTRPSAAGPLCRLEREKLAQSLDRQVARSEELTVLLRRQLETLRDRLADARRQLASLVARQHAAEARREFVHVAGRFDVDLEAFGRFEEFARRVDETEAEADAHYELLGIENEEPDSAAQVEVALEALKNERPTAGL